MLSAIRTGSNALGCLARITNVTAFVIMTLTINDSWIMSNNLLEKSSVCSTLGSFKLILQQRINRSMKISIKNFNSRMWRSQKRTLSTTIQLSSIGRKRTPRFQPHINTWGVGSRDFNRAQNKHDPRYKDLVNFEYIRNANPELRRKQVTKR